MNHLSHEVTELLHQWSSGKRETADKLIPLVYPELRRIAQKYLSKERPNHTLQSTALVHEAYLRLVDQNEVNWEGRAHFFSLATQIMRHILVDHARARSADKRGGHAARLQLEDVGPVLEERSIDLVALDDALQELARIDPRKGQVVELRFFGGLSIEEIAEVLKVSTKTVARDWSFAKLWLHREVARR